MDKTPFGSSPAPAGSTGDADDAAGASKDAAADDSSGGIPRRTMRVTPGSGSYAGLLAHSRPKPAAGATGEQDSGRTGMVSEVPVERTAEITASGRTEGGLSDSQPTLVGGAGTAPPAQTVKKALIPRPTRFTPDQLTALLGPGKNRSPTAAGIAVSAPAAASGPTASAPSDEVTPPPSAAVSVASTAPAPQSEAQVKKSGFAATIMGVARPELSVPGSAGWVGTPWVRPAADSGASWERRAPMDQSGGTSATPFRSGNAVPVGDGAGELTERNPVPAHADSGPVSFSAGSSFSDGGAYDGTLTAVETARSTAKIDVVTPGPRRKAVMTGVAVAAAVTLLGLVWPRLYRSTKVAPPAPVVSAPPALPSAKSPAGNDTPPAPQSPPTPAAPVPLETAPGVEAIKVASRSPSTAASPSAPASTEPEAPVAERESPAEEPPAPREKSSPKAKRSSEEAQARAAASRGAKAEARAEAKAARAEARLLRKEAKEATARAKRNKAEERAVRKEPVLAAPTAEIHVPAARPKAAGVAEDPDGTLPLTGR